MRISNGVKEINAVVKEVFGDYETVDVWTTFNGQWYVSDSPYSIPKWAVDEYAIANELGGAHHLFVRILKKDGSVDLDAAVAYKNNTLLDTRKTQARDGFANIPVYNVFYPDQGANGGWETAPVVPGNTQFGVLGGGLPYGLHVSLFTVYRPKEQNGGNGGNGGNGNGGDVYHKEIWLPKKTVIDLHTNGFEFTLKVDKG